MCFIAILKKDGVRLSMEDEELVLFGDRVKELRFRLRQSQKDFARTLGISPSFLSEIEAGKTKPGYEFFKNITLKHSAHPVFLYTGEGPMFFKEPGEEEDGLAKLGRLLEEEGEMVKQMIRDVQDIPLIRFAVLDFYARYKYRNKPLIDKMVEKELNRQAQKREG
jgi:transcriptional regulator with XRE-family HTH domain